MSYTIADLNKAIENEDSPWEGNWHEFREEVDSTQDLIEVPEGTPGAMHATWYTPPRWQKWVPKENPGAKIPGIGQAVIVDRFGGEGKGDDYWFVFKVTDADGNERLFRRNGWYASYDGGEYDGPTDEVKPQDKVITVWVTV